MSCRRGSGEVSTKAENRGEKMSFIAISCKIISGKLFNRCGLAMLSVDFAFGGESDLDGTTVIFGGR